MQKITQGTFERAEKYPMGKSWYASYGNSLFVRSVTLIMINGTGYLCYYDSTNDGYSYYNGPASVAAKEFLDFEDYAIEYANENSTVAGGN
jgi:hypothetical protein